MDTIPPTTAHRSAGSSQRKGHGLSAVENLVLAGLGLLLYGDSVTLPFFFDDILHIRWVRGNSLLGLWTGAASLGYYRPLPPTLLKLGMWCIEMPSPALLHTINVALHILNAALVVVLTRRVVRPSYYRLTGLVAGILFLSYPFSYQAVPWVGALFHLLVTSLVLGAVLSGIKARSASGWGWRVLSLGMAIAALLTHESGLVIGGWLLAYELICRGYDDDKPRRISLWPLAYLVLGVVYVPLYFSVPRASSPLPPLTLERLIQNGAYLLQGLAFPVAPMTRWTMGGWGWNDLGAAYLAAGLTIGLLVLLGWRGGMRRALGFALICFTLTIIPAWLMLYFNYLISGPRLLYLAGVGAVIAWACGFQLLARLGQGWRRALATGSSLLLVILTVAFGCRFVRVRQAVHRLGGGVIWQVSRIAAATPADERLLVVNYPAWLAPDRLVYPVGHEGVEFMPVYLGVGDLAWANSGVEREIQTAKFANALVKLPGLYCGVRGPEVGWEGLAERIRAADQVYAVHFTPDALNLSRVGRLVDTPFTSTTTNTMSLAVFGGRVALMAAETMSAEEGILVVRLVWQAEGPLAEADYRIFAHLYDASGGLVTQSDGYSMDGLYPFWLWRPGEQIEEIRYLTLPESHPPGHYRIAVGIYDEASGRRLPAFTPEGARFKDDAALISEIRWPGD
ncbi:MAG: hypothetical protein ACE5OS_10560 [Anaerolineae bacterium]